MFFPPSQAQVCSRGVSPGTQKQNRRRSRQPDANGSPGSPGQGSVSSIDERSGVSKMEGSAHDQSNSSAEAAKQERLMRLQMDDLGTARRERLSTEDDPKNIHHVQHQVLEATRGSNIPGTEAYRKASQNRTALAAWAKVGKIVAAQESSHEQLADIGGGQSHRASLNARLAEARSFHNESTRTASAKRARRKSRAGAQVAQSHRHFNPITTRASTMPVVSHSRSQYPPAKVITSGKGQIAKSYDSLSQSPSQESGSLKARGRGHASRGNQVGAVRGRPDTLSCRQIGNWADNISSPQVFLDNLRQHRHLASPPPGTQTPSEPVQSTSQPTRSASRSPRVIWTPRRSASRLSQSVSLRTRSPPVLTQPDPHEPALQPASQPISQSSSEFVHPSALSGVAGNLASDSNISDVSVLGISRQSTHPLPQRRKLVPTSRRPLQNDMTRSMSTLPPRDNLLLDFEDEVQMPTLGQERVLNSVYSELTGLDFGESPLLDWSTSVTPARPDQTPAEVGAAIRAEALDFNRSRGNSALESILGGSHLPDNSPPATLTFESSLFRSDIRVIPVADDPFFLSTSGVPTTEDVSFQASPFSVVTHTGQDNKIAVRDTHSSLTSQSLNQPLFSSYRSPDGTPSSGESKKSKAHDIPSPSRLSPKKVKRADFNPGFERLRVSESPTCAPAAIPTLAAVPTPAVPSPADGPKFVGTLRHSRWAEPRLTHHEIEDSKSRVIGACCASSPA
ncbi:uncharacterized protein N7477_008194 [Penicillium maclennaniae]|uniref:uncharacterized protein n=1 Tax=Penicillium maclennaniae TaxID=1343394 RepID=UPI0025407D1C|nr:uncharacterized protein N7477_008194 [Penicillium maclennaniae]KAJ5665746.1 hypothetical protein N7477_008194 [Penicillium maclennaniae]